MTHELLDPTLCTARSDIIAKEAVRLHPILQGALAAFFGEKMLSNAEMDRLAECQCPRCNRDRAMIAGVAHAAAEACARLVADHSPAAERAIRENFGIPK